MTGQVAAPRRLAGRLLRKRLIDDVLAAYLDWREACASLHDAYRHWSQSEVRDRQRGFLVYSAALDQEQRACAVYAEVARRAARWLAAGSDIVPGALDGSVA